MNKTIMTAEEIAQVNVLLNSSRSEEIVKWGLEKAQGSAVISTNFRPLEAVLLHMVVKQCPDIPVLWVDHGYNTPQTYKFAERLIKQLNLNVKLYIPVRTAAHRDTVNGGIPSIEDQAAHDAFTSEVKLEPFTRGLSELNPRVWFTAIRKSQTDLRAGLEPVSLHTAELIKVSPVLDYTDADMKAYLEKNDLPDEETYYDPTKVLEKRECGLHTLSMTKEDVATSAK